MTLAIRLLVLRKIWLVRKEQVLKKAKDEINVGEILLKCNYVTS